jgi:hypothetical protein
LSYQRDQSIVAAPMVALLIIGSARSTRDLIGKGWSI